MASGSSASTTWIIFLGWPKPCCSSHVWINSNIRWSLWVSMPWMSGRMVQQKNARMIGRIRIARRDPSVNHWKQSEKWLWEQKTNGDHSCNNRWIVILILPAIQHKNCDCDYTQFIQLKLYGGSVLPILLEKEHHHVHNLDFELLSKKGQVELSISLSCAQPHKGRLLLKNDVLRDQNKSPNYKVKSYVNFAERKPHQNCKSPHIIAHFTETVLFLGGFLWTETQQFKWNRVSIARFRKIITSCFRTQLLMWNYGVVWFMAPLRSHSSRLKLHPCS